ncbi:MAG: hypothetical protein EB078_10885 [Proteobacteria bacterium]|nr:hypothetical protein [Pseudomonadota bacterium]NDD05402.1 hypothetical protein [Pseudomonadota bacterium]
MRRGPNIILIIGVALFFSLLGKAHETTQSCVNALENLNRHICRNFFETRRDFARYAEAFPATVLRDLSLMSPDGHWIDAGSGEGFAIQDFFNGKIFDVEAVLKNAQPSSWRPRRLHLDSKTLIESSKLLHGKRPGERGYVTGVTFKMERTPPQIDKLTVHTGQFFEDIPTHSFAPADVITDLYGVMSYSPRVDEGLRSYHQLLKEGGRAYVFIGDYLESPELSGSRRLVQHGIAGWDAPYAQSRVRKKNGQTVSLLEWTMDLPGFNARLEYNQVDPSPRFGVVPGIIQRHTLVLEKTNQQATIPHLRLLNADEGKPPLRIFEEVSE